MDALKKIEINIKIIEFIYWIYGCGIVYVVGIKNGVCYEVKWFSNNQERKIGRFLKATKLIEKLLPICIDF